MLHDRDTPCICQLHTTGSEREREDATTIEGESYSEIVGSVGIVIMTSARHRLILGWGDLLWKYPVQHLYTKIRAIPLGISSHLVPESASEDNRYGNFLTQVGGPLKPAVTDVRVDESGTRKGLDVVLLCTA